MLFNFATYSMFSYASSWNTDFNNCNESAFVFWRFFLIFFFNILFVAGLFISCTLTSRISCECVRPFLFIASFFFFFFLNHRHCYFHGYNMHTALLSSISVERPWISYCIMCSRNIKVLFSVCCCCCYFVLYLLILLLLYAFTLCYYSLSCFWLTSTLPLYLFV